MKKPTRYELEAAEEVKAFVNQTATICPSCGKDFEHTEEDNDYCQRGKGIFGFPVDLPPRKIPDGGLKAKRKQTEKPTLLEMYQEEVRQRKLF